MECRASLEDRIRAAMTWAATQSPPRLSDMEGRTLFGYPIVESE